MVREKLKGFSKDAVLYGVGDAFGRLIGLILLPILSRIFIPADYGVIDLLSVSYAFVLLLSKLAIPSGVQRFYYRREGEERRSMVASCLVYMELGGLIIAGLMVALSTPLSHWIPGDPRTVRGAIYVLAYCLPFELAWDYLVLLLRLQRRAITFSIANIARVLITPTATYYLVAVRETGVPGVFAAKAASLTLITLALGWVLRREFSRQVVFDKYFEVFRFAIPGHPDLLIRNAMAIAPIYLLANFAPLTAVGLFGVAMRLSKAMKIFVGAFNRAWNPFAYANEGSPDERRLYEIVFKALFAMLVLLTSALALFARELLIVLTPERYLSAYVLVPGIAAYLGAEGIVLMFSTVLYTRNRVRWASYLAGLRLVMFAIAGFLLVPDHAAKGLVLALDISALFYVVAYGALSRLLFPFDLPIKRMLAFVTIAALLVFAFNAIELRWVARVLIKAGVWAGLVVTCFALMLDSGERRKLRSLLPWRG